MFDLDSCQYKLPLFDAPFPSFILRGAGTSWFIMG